MKKFWKINSENHGTLDHVFATEVEATEAAKRFAIDRQTTVTLLEATRAYIPEPEKIPIKIEVL